MPKTTKLIAGVETKMKIRGLSSKNSWDYEHGFYWFSKKVRIAKAVAQYELYKTIADLPGDVFELGVYRGASLIRLGTFRDVIETGSSRKIVGFDAFGKFPRENLTLREDFEFIDWFDGSVGHGLEKLELESILANKGFENIELMEGNIFTTLPEYLDKYPQTRLAMINLDLDVKEPTDFALDLLYDRLVPGALILFDDYNVVAGATMAADIFAQSKGLKIKKLKLSNSPAFIIKA